MRVLVGFSLSAALLAGGASTAQAQTPAPAPAAAARPPITDARENAPPGLIGLWKADLALSKYPTAAAKPRTALRSFSYDAEGKILVTFMTVGANGAYTTGHWAAQLDGPPGIEYHSTAASVPFNVVAWTKIDDKTLDLKVSRHGKLDIHATYKLSDDLKTLTYAYDGYSIVYRRWDGMDW